MAKEIILAAFILIVALLFLGGYELTGHAIDNSCAGNNDYYICVDGNGDIVLDGQMIPAGEMDKTISGKYHCKLANLDNNEEFVMRYNGAERGVIYNSNEEFLGENSNDYTVSNYNCSISEDCAFSCSQYKIWQ